MQTLPMSGVVMIPKYQDCVVLASPTGALPGSEIMSVLADFRADEKTKMPYTHIN